MSEIHEDVKEGIARILRERGYNVKTAAAIGNRRVDIQASNDKETFLIEVAKVHYSRDLRVEIKPVTRSMRKGTLVIKRIPCGKNCSGCPHGPYIYRVTKKDGKQTWEYLGKAEEQGR